MERNDRYSIEEMAELGGVTRRTVRYYVQEQLLPSPLGVGRGRHYGPEHLARLRRLKALQEEGLSLAEVRARLWQDDAEHGGAGSVAPSAPAERSVHQSRLVRDGDARDIDESVPASREVPARSTWTRIVMRPGVELHLAAEVEALSPEALEALARWCREHLRRDEPGASE